MHEGSEHVSVALKPHLLVVDNVNWPRLSNTIGRTQAHGL
jgi:hypothetical protein